MEKAITHANAIMNTSVLKGFLFVFIPESIRFKFNMTTYPAASDKFFRGLASKIIEEAKNRDSGSRSDFAKDFKPSVSLMNKSVLYLPSR